jgi:hypothetical protein
MLTQEEAAATLQTEIGVLQQQLSTERDLMVEAQISLTITQVSCLTTLCSHLCSNWPFVAYFASVFFPALTLT